MERLKNKKGFNKILMMLLVIMCFNFICPLSARAESDLGGILLEPVANLLTSVGDGILNIVHDFVMGQEHAIIHTSSNIWQTIVSIVLGVVAAAVVIAVTWFIPGLNTISIGAVLLVGTGVGVFAYNNLPSDKLSFPVYSISPEEIFMNKIPLLDINFFNPDTNKATYDEVYTTTTNVTGVEIKDLIMFGSNVYYEGEKTSLRDPNAGIFQSPYYDADTYYFYYNGNIHRILKYKNISPSTSNPVISVEKKNDNVYEQIRFYVSDWSGKTNNKEVVTVGKEFINQETSIIQILKEDYGVTTKVTEEEFNVCITDEYLLKNAEKNGNTYILTSKVGDTNYRLAIDNFNTSNEVRTLYTMRSYTIASSTLQSVIAKWYVTLRNIALVLSMSILVYVGIRMMLASVASQKAKYKEMLYDWLIGVCLMFVLHYGMVFAVYLNEQIINLVTATEVKVPEYVSKIKAKDDNGNIKSNIKKFINEYYKITGQKIAIDSYGYMEYNTNLMGNVRLLLQNNVNDKSLSYVGYVIMFLVLIIYTLAFLFTYLKRVIYMALLTILAPFVAMTYPLDKVNDGQAQAFNMWIKEYLFNLLIQPMHLLLYYVLVSSAIDLATKNVLYSLVALGFLMPAEKIVRSFFGFDKAKTPGFLNSAAEAGLVMSAVGSLRRFGDSGKREPSAAEQNKDGKMRTKDFSALKLSDTEFGKNIKKYEQETEKEIKEAVSNQKKINSIAVGQLKERLDELTAEGFEKGDSEYDKVQQELQHYLKRANSVKSDSNESTSQSRELEEILQKGEEVQNEDTKRTLGQKWGGMLGAAIGGPFKGAIRLTGKIPNLAARGFGAATLGAVGLAAGIATGDASNALKYGLTGAGAGNALGSGVANRVTSSVSGYSDDILRGWYGDTYDSEYANMKSDKYFMADKETRDEYKAEFGSNYKERMEDALEYRKYGITDNAIIIKAMSLSNKYGGSDKKSKEKIYVAQLASKISSRSELARLRESFEREHVQESRIRLVEEGIRFIKEW